MISSPGRARGYGDDVSQLWAEASNGAADQIAGGCEELRTLAREWIPALNPPQFRQIKTKWMLLPQGTKPCGASPRALRCLK